MSELQSRAELFAVGGFRAVEIGAADVPRLQELFELNPAYFIAVNGQPALPTEAHEEIHGPLPEGWPFTKKWLIGVADETGALVGIANVVSDLLAVGVWHIGLFLVATRLHGTGVAKALYEALEAWARHHGARWLRLGVVQGHMRAERFWEARAFVEVRKRAGVEMGTRVNTLRVMMKPLAGGTLPEYLALVQRDRPES